MDDIKAKQSSLTSADHESRLRSGLYLGKYRLQKRLGKGGYCEVWRARDTVEGIWVALKIPLPDQLGQRDNEAILREIRLVAHLKHRNIMSVKNADIINGHAVLATEISTKTLDDCSRPMSPARIISIAHQVLNGLSFAHQKKIVHCDVTPGNIFLFPNSRAAIGDFGIGILFKGRMKTIDDYGTPGYVAPEQAFGKPTYRSDCFSVALILYEYLTGVLPRWPFHWPPKGLDRLRQKTGSDFAGFIKKALNPDPQKRFANARIMLMGLEEALPLRIRKKVLSEQKKLPVQDWQKLRRKAFLERYSKVLVHTKSCVGCGEPVAESMQCCPWCGSEKNRFDNSTSFSHLCHRCHRGVAPEWNYCPWCYGPGFIPQDPGPVKIKYNARCSHCLGKMMNFMKYCPWCHQKPKSKWQVHPFPEICGSCGCSVDSNYWLFCPWCCEKLF